MSSIEQLNNGLTDVAKQIVNTTPQYKRITNFLLDTEVKVAVEKIAEGGQQMAQVVASMPDTWQGLMAGIVETADECTAKVTGLAVEQDRAPHEHIATALGGLKIMAEGGRTCNDATVQMHRKLQDAMGHLAGFTQAMQEYESLSDTASRASGISYEGGMAALEGIESYVRGN